MTEADPSLSYLLNRLGVIEARVRVTVATRRAEDPSAEDPFRGLYLSDEQVDRMLAGAAPPPPPDQETGRFLAAIEAEADAAEATGADLRLRRLARSFGLEPLDVELLLVAMAPDLDSRFERLYGYLHDDVTRRRASIGLALELAGLPPAAGRARQRLTPSGPLVAAGLVTVDEHDRPFLTRSLQVPDRVTRHLLGDDHDDTDLLHLLAEARSDAAPDPSGLARSLRAGARLCYLREKPGSSGRSLAAAALAAAGRPIVAIDLGRLGTGEDPAVVARTAMRDARLRGAGLVAGGGIAQGAGKPGSGKTTTLLSGSEATSLPKIERTRTRPLVRAWSVPSLSSVASTGHDSRSHCSRGASTSRRRSSGSP
ncbi:MAG: hypothetical protein KY439_08665, partial [Actinobacteria bacterium]|nr:hypothetical protein [Actinomycetota bacterium]